MPRWASVISDALERCFGRHRADTQKVTGVYTQPPDDSAEGWDKLQAEIEVCRRRSRAAARA